MDTAHEPNGMDVEHGVKLLSPRGAADGRVVSRLELHLTEAAGMLLAWSLLALVEGVVRTVLNARPEVGLTPDEGFPPLALLVAGVAEIVFSILGLLVAVAVLVYRLRSATVLLGFLIVQSILGWFVFITYVIALPAYNADHLEVLQNNMTTNGFSKGLERFLIFLGIVTSVVWCAALQAGQFILAARVMAMLKGKYDSYKMHKLRAAVWTALALLAGVAIFLSACLVLAKKDGDTPFLPPPAFPPNVNIYPQILIVTGLLTMPWAALGLAGAITGSRAFLSAFNRLWFVVFFANLVPFAMVLGKVPAGVLAGPAAQHAVLTFAYTFLPVIFTSKLVDYKDYGDIE